MLGEEASLGPGGKVHVAATQTTTDEVPKLKESAASESNFPNQLQDARTPIAGERAKLAIAG